MTTVQITLPDQLAQEAAQAGLLAPPRVERWLREQLKAERVGELFAAIERMNATPTPSATSPDEIAQEMTAMRAERRAKAAR